MASLSHHLYPGSGGFGPFSALAPPPSLPTGHSSFAGGGGGGGLPYFSGGVGAVGGGGGGGGVPAASVGSASLYNSDNQRLYASEPSSRHLGGEHPGYGSSASYLVPMTPPPPQNLQLSGWGTPPSTSWHQAMLDHPMVGTKRPVEEVLYSGDVLSKRPRVDSIPDLPVYPQRPGEKDCAFYMKTRTCSFGPSCRFDHPTWVPAGGIPDWKEVSVNAPNSDFLPIRPGESDCSFYMKTGVCKFGAKCKFNHPKDRSVGATEKKESDQNGTIFNDAKGTSNETAAMIESKNNQAAAGTESGDAKNAPPRPATGFNSKGLPIRPGETDCAFYMKKGSCKFGSTCRFNHPDKKPAPSLQVQQAVLPALGGLPVGVGRLPSYPGALPDFGLNVPGSGFGMSTGAIQGLSVASNLPPYPQRPGEKDCPYFMKTGNCKYGASCMFHHPMNRLDPSYVDPGVKLTLAGLPRREGESACTYYMKTGSCRYGSTCKYDHPPPGEAAAKALAEASKNEPNISSDSDQGDANP